MIKHIQISVSTTRGVPATPADAKTYKVELPDGSTDEQFVTAASDQAKQAHPDAVHTFFFGISQPPFAGLEGRDVKTYRQLLLCLQLMNDEQLDATITVEDPYEQECYAAELRIADSNHDSLDDYHPVIYMGSKVGTNGD